MNDLDVCRLSAEACGHLTHNNGDGYLWIDGTETVWNPLTIAEQRDECMEWLLKEHVIQFIDGRMVVWQRHWPDALTIEGPYAKLPARAVAELQVRKGK